MKEQCKPELGTVTGRTAPREKLMRYARAVAAGETQGVREGGCLCARVSRYGLGSLGGDSQGILGQSAGKDMEQAFAKNAKTRCGRFPPWRLTLSVEDGCTRQRENHSEENGVY